MKIDFNRPYALISLCLLLIETGIALFVHDHFIRPFVGDVLVVALVYTCVRMLLQGPALPIAAGVLVFACSVEGAQALHLVQRLGLEHHTLARIIIGSTFDWMDILAYVLGTALVLAVELKRPPSAGTS